MRESLPKRIIKAPGRAINAAFHNLVDGVRLSVWEYRYHSGDRRASLKRTLDVVDMYRQVLDRMPDREGLGIYRDQIAQGRSRREIREELLRSTEFDDKMDQIVDKEGREKAIKDLYKRALLRRHDRNGLHHFLDGKYPVGVVRDAMVESDEFRRYFPA
jgi:hypothetical protein